MFQIMNQKQLNSNVTKLVILAPRIAAKIKPGQFVILRVDAEGERVPFTVADTNEKEGTITIIFQILGATTKKMSMLEKGDSLQDVLGPLGKPTVLAGLKKAAIIGGGSGCAIAFPLAKELYKQGTVVHAITGFRSKELVIMQEEFFSNSALLSLVTDDGSAGEKGLVTNALERLILSGEQYDEVFAIGPLPMMKFVALLTQRYGIKTTVSMNSIMIDGTGMCGCCRLSVAGEMKLACVDGPDFDGHQVDFDEAISRMNIYQEFEHHAYEEACNLLKKEVNNNA